MYSSITFLFLSTIFTWWGHMRIAIGNGHLCHVQRPANDMISGQPGTYYAAKFL